MKEQLILEFPKKFRYYPSLKGKYKGLDFRVRDGGGDLPSALAFSLTLKKKSDVKFKISIQLGVYLRISGWKKIRFQIPSKKGFYYINSKNTVLLNSICQRIQFQRLLASINESGIETININPQEIYAEASIIANYRNFPYNYKDFSDLIPVDVRNQNINYLKDLLDKLIKLSDCKF